MTLIFHNGAMVGSAGTHKTRDREAREGGGDGGGTNYEYTVQQISCYYSTTAVGVNHLFDICLLCKYPASESLKQHE